MSEEALKHEIATLRARVATLEQTIESHERAAKSQAEQLEQAMRDARERSEALAQSEEELRRQASIFKMVLDSMADGVAVVDEHGEVVLRNPAADRMLARSATGVLLGDGGDAESGLFFTDKVTPWPASEHPLARALRGDVVDQVELFSKRPSSAEQRAARKAGAVSLSSAPGSGALADDVEPRSVRVPSTFDALDDASAQAGVFLTVTANPMRRKDGSISGAVAVFRDATERKRLIEDLEAKNRDLIESESAKTELVERLRYAIDEISTPILELWDDVLALPIIGVVDSRRSAQIMERLLDEIVRRQSRFVIIDVTGVEVIDTRTADHFMKLIKAVELLGARCRITGVRPAVAQTLVELGIDLGAVRAARNLKHALRESLVFTAQKPTLASLTGAKRGAAQGRGSDAEAKANHVNGNTSALGPASASAAQGPQNQLSVRKETST